jgi:hypothetical protein
MTMKSKYVRLVIAAPLALLCCGLAACAATTQTARRCGAKPDQPAHRLFADPDGMNHWREYKKLSAVPQGNPDGSALARVWAGNDGQDYVLVQWGNQDWAWSTEYCFDKSGQLTQLRHELRTAWGWGRRQEGPFANSRFVPETSEFFSTESEQPIRRPEVAADVGSALEPKIYRTRSQLPFSRLLSS